MEYVYAVLLLHKAGKEINEENIKNVLQAAGVEVDDARVKALVSALEGKDIDKLIEEAKQTYVAAAPAVAATQETKEEEKKEEEKKEEEEEKKEEEALGGLSSLFGF
jgi:large subunit ribosomal protein L12